VLEVTNIRVRSYDLGHLDVYWDIAPCFEDVLNYTFTVLRSDTEFGPFEPISRALVDSYHFRDSATHDRFSKYSPTYYAIRIDTRGGSQTPVTYPTSGKGVRLEALPDLAALEMSLQERLKLKQFKGRLVWVYRKRTFGQRCPSCFDPVMGRHVTSNCQVCFNTSWVGGYHAPVATYAQIVTPDEQIARLDIGKVESQDSVILLANVPEIFEGDLILELENVRWRVGPTIRKYKKARALVRQQAGIHGIQREDIEYTIPLNVSPDVLKDTLASPEGNYLNRQTIGSDELQEVLRSFFRRRG